MPLSVLPKQFQSFPKVVTQLEESEKIDLFNGPIPGKNFDIFFISHSTIFFFLINIIIYYFRGVLGKISSKY